MKKKPRIVRIRFLDHCKTINGVDNSLECEVYGVLFKEDKKHYFIASWLANGQIDENTDSYSILKSTVLKVTTLGKF